jgi:hypothetical protein
MGMEGSDAMPFRAATAFNPSSSFAERAQQTKHGSRDVKTVRPTSLGELVRPFAETGTHLHVISQACESSG